MTVGQGQWQRQQQARQLSRQLWLLWPVNSSSSSSSRQSPRGPQRQKKASQQQARSSLPQREAKEAKGISPVFMTEVVAECEVDLRHGIQIGFLAFLSSCQLQRSPAKSHL
jgi:hypothetical protein